MVQRVILCTETFWLEKRSSKAKDCREKEKKSIKSRLATTLMHCAAAGEGRDVRIIDQQQGNTNKNGTIAQFSFRYERDRTRHTQVAYTRESVSVNGNEPLM